MLSRLYHSFWRDSFIACFTWVVFLLFFVGGALHAVTAPGRSTARAGDFPAFYAAAKLSLEAPSSLYDLDAQRKSQEKFFPKEEGYHVFAYPPFVAALLAPLAYLDPLPAKGAFVLLLSVVAFAAAKFLRKQARLEVSDFQAFCLLLFFYPFGASVLGGQNSAVSLGLLILIVLAAAKERWLWAGAAAGLWNFKPQYSAICILFLLVRSPERIRLLVGFLLAGLAEFFLSVLCFGSGIFEKWLSLLSSLGQMNFASPGNIGRMVSLPSIARAWVSALGPEKAAYAWPIIAVLAILGVYVLYRNSKDDLQIIGPLIVMLSPQTGFYDLALVLPFILNRTIGGRSELIWQFLFADFVIGAVLFLQFEFYAQLVPLLLLFVLLVFSRRRPFDLTAKAASKHPLVFN